MPNEAASNLTFEFDALRQARNYRAALSREFKPYLHGRVIEVGAGVGHFTEVLQQLASIEDLIAVEPEPSFCDRLRRSFSRPTVLCETAAALKTEADAIICINVLEHIQKDEEELRIYHDLLLARHGHLCLFVPARPEIYAPLDRDFGHHRRYTRKELRRKLSQNGFAITSLRYFNAIGYAAWWFSFCILKQRGFNERAVKLFDRLIFPPVYWWESRVMAPPIGQSLIAVAQAS